MIQRKNGWPQTQGQIQPRGHQPVNPQLHKLSGAQAKMAIAGQVKKPPVAPPVYRPQSKPQPVQPKMAHATAQNPRQPVAPPVYRPQPAPHVLQRRVADGRQPHAVHPPRQPVAPPVHRPLAQPPAAQAKMAGTAQMRTNPVAPPVYRPQPLPKVLQAATAHRQTGVQPQMENRQPGRRSGAPGKGQAPGRNNSIVQRYKNADIKELYGEGKLSENGNYFLPDTYRGQVLYAEVNAAAPRSSVKHQWPIATHNKTYQGYLSSKFREDCLHTAEEICANKELELYGDYSQVSGTTKNFGRSSSENIKLAKAHGVDDTAAPNVGQAYVIVNKDWGKKGNKVAYPYHAAAVVAVDGKDRITLEVFAGEKDASQRNTYGDYSMYTTGTGSGDKFHTHWKGSVFTNDAATVVIESK